MYYSSTVGKLPALLLNKVAAFMSTLTDSFQYSLATLLLQVVAAVGGSKCFIRQYALPDTDPNLQLETIQ